MDDKRIQELIKQLRDYTSKKRLENSEIDLEIFFLNVIEIACSLTELGIIRSRSIKTEEEYWFQASYHMNFWNSEIEEKVYTPLVEEVKARNYFRKS
jgi:hypothetical protein